MRDGIRLPAPSNCTSERAVMKRTISLATLICLAAGFLSLPRGYSQDTAKKAPKPPAAKPETAKVETAAPKVKNRLPNNFGKLGLSDEQRDKIYAIQAQRQVEIDKLEKQLEVLRNQEDAEVQAVLTKEQQTKLGELTAAAKAKRDAAKTKPDADGEAAPATAPEKPAAPEKKPAAAK